VTKEIRPLSEYPVMWMWSGKGIISYGNSDLEGGCR